MFNHASSHSGFNKGLSMAKVDAVEGFLQRSFKAPIDRINGAICTNDVYSLALPHLLIEFKGPEGSMLVGRSQCAYDAAFAVYGHDEAMKSLGKHVTNDKKVIVFSMSTNGELTDIFGHFATTKDTGDIIYYQCRLVRLPCLADEYEDFKKACSIIHNLQHLARQRSATLRDMLEAAEIASKNAASAVMPPPPSPSSKRPSSDPASSPSKRARVE